MSFRLVLGVWLALSAPAGSALADIEAGMRAYANGDYATALRELTPVAENGNALAQFTIGFMYTNGRGVPQDDEEAFRWYLMAAEQQHADAQFQVGLAYATGSGASRNEPEAARW